MPERAKLHSMFESVIACAGDRAPRYTSYPPANRLHSDNSLESYEIRFQHLANTVPVISLYGHIPFCQSLCFFCACNREVTKNHARSRRYLDAIKNEIELLGSKYFGTIPVRSLHLGGGTPNFLSSDELDELLNHYKQFFHWQADTGFSIELDPRTTTKAQMQTLAVHQCSRISVGVQDFDPRVQKRINRVQSFEQTQKLFYDAKDVGIQRTGVDIIYGLPLQTRETFRRTLASVVKLQPDRIAVYGYAHVVAMAPGQQSFTTAELPTADQRLDLLADAISYFTAHGYYYIGIDHFVKSSDPLYQAYCRGSLGRSFMGYTSERGIPVIATGASSISMFPNLLVQNVRAITKYESAMLDTPKSSLQLPIEKGFIKNQLAMASAAAIESLLTVGYLDFRSLRSTYGSAALTVEEYANPKLKEFEERGLILKEAEHVYLTKLGQIFGRAVASCLDTYLINQDSNSVQSISVNSAVASLLI